MALRMLMHKLAKASIFGLLRSARNDGVGRLWKAPARGPSIGADRAGAGNRAGRAFAQDDHAEYFVLGNVFGLGDAGPLTVLHDGYAIGQIEHVVNVVADEEYADPVGLQLLDEF